MRAITEIIEALRNFSTTELCDGMTEFRVLDPAIRRMATKKKIAGTAFPVEIPAGVSGIIPDALMEIGPGQVLVIAAHHGNRAGAGAGNSGAGLHAAVMLGRLPQLLR